MQQRTVSVVVGGGRAEHDTLLAPAQRHSPRLELSNCGAEGSRGRQKRKAAAYECNCREIPGGWRGKVPRSNSSSSPGQSVSRHLPGRVLARPTAPSAPQPRAAQTRRPRRSSWWRWMELLVGAKRLVGSVGAGSFFFSGRGCLTFSHLTHLGAMREGGRQSGRGTFAAARIAVSALAETRTARPTHLRSTCILGRGPFRHLCCSNTPTHAALCAASCLPYPLLLSAASAACTVAGRPRITACCYLQGKRRRNALLTPMLNWCHTRTPGMSHKSPRRAGPCKQASARGRLRRKSELGVQARVSPPASTHWST